LASIPAAQGARLPFWQLKEQSQAERQNREVDLNACWDEICDAPSVVGCARDNSTTAKSSGNYCKIIGQNVHWTLTHHL
jgi:hypothetical protein